MENLISAHKECPNSDCPGLRLLALFTILTQSTALDIERDKKMMLKITKLEATPPKPGSLCVANQSNLMQISIRNPVRGLYKIIGL